LPNINRLRLGTALKGRGPAKVKRSFSTGEAGAHENGEQSLNQRAQGSNPCAPTNDYSLYSLPNVALANTTLALR